MSAATLSPSELLLDPAFPFAARALDRVEAARLLAPALLDSRRGGGELVVEGIRVLRHKPGRRCIIEYELVIPRRGAPSGRTTVLGKVRARGVDAATPRLVAALRSAGFACPSSDGIEMPEPLGLVPELRMWLQRKECGVPLTASLLSGDDPRQARRAAEAISKLHAARVDAHRTHTLADELAILKERLLPLGRERPGLLPRLERLLDLSSRLASRVREPEPTGIHRDFHPGQLLVDGDRIVLLDLDLYAAGDPAVDAGNFLAHVVELAVRQGRRPEALADVAEAFRERFLALAPDRGAPERVRVYELLTLVRHVALSTRYPDRLHTTEPLLSLCEEELSSATDYPAS